MTLQEFITESIKSIIKGVSDGHEHAKEKKAIINPIRTRDTMRAAEDKWMWQNEQDAITRPITRITFDVAVVVSSEENSQVGGGLNIQIFNASGKMKNTENNQTTSRISFTLDIALPNNH